MDTSNIIKGVVNSGRYTVTAPIIKEDYGIYLQIEGVELPQTYEVDFSNSEHNGTSVTMIGNSDGVLIPSQFISTGKDIFAFLYHVGADYGRTVYKFRIPNKVRPDRTNEEPTPEEQSTIDQLIGAMNTAVAQTAQDKADADASAQNASADADRAEEARTDAQNYATQAGQSATDAQESASQAQTSAQTASAKAQDASGYAQTATQKATESAQSATNAQGYAQTAEQAKTASQTAQGLAESARDSAIQAKESAESAKADAESARDEAVQAVESISGALDDKADVITDTVSGSIASFPDGADDLPLKSLVVNIDPVQDTSSGDPSPENICPISGWTEVDVNHSGADMTNPTTLTIPLGQTVYGGKLDVLSGKLTVDRYMVDLGTVTWNYATDNQYPVFYADKSNFDTGKRPLYTNGKITVMCSDFKAVTNKSFSLFANGSTSADFSVAISSSGTTQRVLIRDSRYTDTASFKTAMDGVHLVYMLYTPYEIQLDAHTLNSLYGQNNIFADTGDCAVEYRADTKLYINRLTEPDADMIADSNITSGQYFMVGNNLYKATANIANGGQITVGTNCTRVSLAQALNEINA